MSTPLGISKEATSLSQAASSLSWGGAAGVEPAQSPGDSNSNPALRQAASASSGVSAATSASFLCRM
eukprot:13744115-Alexandrium_andersonii.AAC.1